MSDSRDEGYWSDLGISEVAKLLHIPPSTLRYYEEEGLVTPTRTESSGYRKYSLLALIELADIMFYRKIGVPIKDIQHLMESPIEESASAVDKALDETIERMQELDRTLRMLSLYNQRIRKYYMVRSRGSRFVSQPEIEQVYQFGMKEEASLQAYLDDLATSYGVFIESAEQADAYIDCAVKPVDPDHARPLWRRQDHACAYLECLLRTDYCYAQHNDLAQHVSHLRSLGKEPGFVVAQYLTYDYSETDQKRYDYYLAWIQVVER